MPQYVVLQSHPPGDCPVASKAAREWVKKTFPQMQRIAEEMGVKFVIPYLHLDPAHKGLLVLEAPSAETVRDFVVRAGHFHYLDMSCTWSRRSRTCCSTWTRCLPSIHSRIREILETGACGDQW